jgi:hypothetical protein
MNIHIALFKWKSNATPEQISQALKNVQELKNKVDGIQDVFVGENYHKESKGFTHGVVVVAENQKSLDSYRKHPNHTIVADLIEKIEENGLGFDFKNLK